MSNKENTQAKVTEETKVTTPEVTTEAPVEETKPAEVKETLGDKLGRLGKKVGDGLETFGRKAKKAAPWVLGLAAAGGIAYGYKKYKDDQEATYEQLESDDDDADDEFESIQSENSEE